MFFSKRFFSVKHRLLTGTLFVALGLSAHTAIAQDYSSANTDANYSNNVVVQPEEKKHFWSGDWSLTLGVSGATAPRYEGSNSNEFKFSPMFSFGRQGGTSRFSSRNDNPSFSIFSNENISIGVVGKLLEQRDSDTSNTLKGLKRVKWGMEAGAFADIFVVDWLRIHGELRQGIRSHNGFVGNFAIDAIADVTPTVRISGGPRMFVASEDYFDAYYGVSARESVRSGLKKYKPSGGVGSVGVGGAITWKTTDKITTSLFGEYNRLTGPAEDSSLVKQRGSENQFTLGMSATYRFDFSLR